MAGIVESIGPLAEEGLKSKRMWCDECEDAVGGSVWYQTCRKGVHTQGRHKKHRRRHVAEQSEEEAFPTGWGEEGAAGEEDGPAAGLEAGEEEGPAVAGLGAEEVEEIEREVAQEVWEDALEELDKELAADQVLQPEDEQYFDALQDRTGVEYNAEMGAAPDEEGDEFGDAAAALAAEDEAGPPLREPEYPRSFWWQKRNEKIYEGSPFTVRETAFHLLSQKVQHNTKDNEFNDRLRLEHHHLRPPGNLYPPSLHVCKVVLGVEPIQRYSKHVCVNDCYGSFPDLQEEDWAAHAEDRCPVCEEARFVSYRVAGGVKYRPRKEYWDFGLRETIGEYFADEDYCKLRRTERTDRSDFWSGEYAERIDEWSGRIFLELDNGAWEIGLDWGQVYNFKQHSTGFVMIRPLDIPPEHRGEARFTKVLAVLPGPKEPKNLQTYLQRTFAGFKELGPFGGPGGATRGLRVFDIHAKRWHTHVPFAPIVSADTPARAKFGGFLAPAAFVACFHCEFEGHKYEDAKKGTYFAGYAHPSPLDVAGGGESVFAWDAPQKSDAVHRSNCREVEANRLDPNKCGNKFLPEVAKALPYFDMSWGFAIPFAHAALLGVVKSFWLLALFNYTCKEGERENYWIPKARRKLMTARAAMIHCTVEAGRPYRDIVTNCGSWTMEDWLHWTETYSLFIARDILPPTMEAAWQALRKAVVHYARLDETTLSASERKAARDNFREYAVFVDKYLPADECTLNLHTVVCHTFEQESQTGSIFEMSEFWIERLIGTLKKCVKYRMTTQPEKVIVGYYLLKRRLLELSRVIKSVEYKEQASHTIKDDESTRGGSFFLQSGQVTDIVGEAGAIERNAIVASVTRMGIDFFEIDSQTVAIKFKVAYSGGEIVQSKAYLQARERVSYCVSVKYHQQVWDRQAKEFCDQCETRWGVVHYFLKIESRNVNEDRVLRLAKVTLYHSATPSKEGEMEVIDESRPFRANVFVRLDDITSKVLFAKDEKPYRRNKTYVLPFMTTRKL